MWCPEKNYHGVAMGSRPVKSAMVESVSQMWGAQMLRSTTGSIMNQSRFPAVSEIARGILQVGVLN